MKNWFEELMFQHQRRAPRYIEPRLVAFYWDGAAPEPRYIRDVSSTGFYLLTEQRWYPGTLITMTLQRTEKTDDGSKSSIAVQAKVIRSGDDGVALAFVLPRAKDARSVISIIADGVGLADKKTLELFLRPLWVNHPIRPGGA
jgi:PilZ domain-containing protein